MKQNKNLAIDILKKLHDKYPERSNVTDSLIKTSIKIGDFCLAKKLINTYHCELIEELVIKNSYSVNLHIGVHKTATTYVQNTLEMNSVLLAEEGISFIPLNTIRNTLSPIFINNDVRFDLIAIHTLITDFTNPYTKILILSEENIIHSRDGNLIEHIYGDIQYNLNIIKFYLSEIFQIDIRKIVITLRSYDSFFPSFFMESNRHKYIKKSDLTLKKILNFSWIELLEKINKVFNKNKIHILFLEDFKKNEATIFDAITENNNIYQKLKKSSNKRRSPNYKAYEQVECLYRSFLDGYSLDFLRYCLLYPEMFQEALQKQGLHDPDAKKLSEHIIFDVHTEKLRSNLLFTKEETLHLQKKYFSDKKYIQHKYNNFVLDKKQGTRVPNSYSTAVTPFYHKINRKEITLLKSKIIDCGIQEYSFGGKAYIKNHLDMLKKEFHDKSYLEYYHSGLIVHIRRNINTELAWSNFQLLWLLESDFLSKNLDTRWLVSACDTIIDHSDDPTDIAIAMAGTTFANTLKLYETERYLTKAKQNDYDVSLVQTGNRIPLFDGMSAFVIGEGDMIFNLINRINNYQKQNSIAFKIFQELINRANTNDTVYRRFYDKHQDKKTLW